MAFEIIKCYKERFPALRLIGKRYTDDDRVNGDFNSKWNDWKQNSWFNELEKQAAPSDKVDNGYLGLMTIGATNHDNFSYWIGILFPADTAVPEGFSYIDLPESDIGISWIYGSDETGEIYESHSASYQKLCDNGWSNLNTNAGGDDTLVFFERYNCPRITTPDDKGNVILDYGFYLA